MLRHHGKFPNENFVLTCRLPDARFDKVFILQLPHHLIAVLGAPFKVPEVRSDLVAVSSKVCLCHVRSAGESYRYFGKLWCAASPAPYSAAKPLKKFSVENCALKGGGLDPTLASLALKFSDVFSIPCSAKVIPKTIKTYLKQQIEKRAMQKRALADYIFIYLLAAVVVISIAVVV